MYIEKKISMSSKWRWWLPQLQQLSLWPFVRTVLVFFIKFEVYGLENIKNLKNSVIFVPNHASELDPLLVFVALPWFSKFAPIFYVASEDKTYKNNCDLKWRKHLYGGFLFRSFGAYPVVSGMKDYAKSMPWHEEILKYGGNVCLFPEGRCSKSSKHTNAHGGVAYLAEKTGATIIPVAISGIWNLRAKNFFRRELEVSVSFGKSILAKDIINKNEDQPEKYKNAAKKIMSKVEIILAELND